MSEIRPEREADGTPAFSHIPVMLSEVLSGLDIRPDGIYVDGTAGGGGHSEAIAERLSDRGLLIAIDRDGDAVKAASARLERFGERARVVHANYADMKQVCADLGVQSIDGFLLDLGVSSYQLDNPDRGFSYMSDAPLSMQMDRTEERSARDVVNGYSGEELTRILREWGEERFAGRIAAEICRRRSAKPIETTLELVDAIGSAIPAGGRPSKHHFAMRAFQAIRIEVNREIEIIPGALREAVGLLKYGGRGAVITFHSVEDRAVKETFAELAAGCVCPKDLPVCVCGRRPEIKLITKKPLTPGAEELAANGRSHSAKLRLIEKTKDTKEQPFFRPGNPG